MRETFLLKGHSFSINAMYGPKKFKTSAARDWETTVLHQLSSNANEKKFANLREYFDPEKHAFAITIVVQYPVDKFYTKVGNISSHTQDVSNVEKPLVDLFFLPKYYTLNPPYGCRNLNCDDKFITRMLSIKRPSDEYSVKVILKIINR